MLGTALRSMVEAAASIRERRFCVYAVELTKDTTVIIDDAMIHAEWWRSKAMLRRLTGNCNCTPVSFGEILLPSLSEMEESPEAAQQAGRR